MRKFPARIAKADGCQQLSHAHATLLPVRAAQAEGDVVGHRQVRKQGIVLKHHADFALFGRQMQCRGAHDDAIETNFAAADALEAGNGPRHGRLAAARRAEQAADGALLQRKGEGIHHNLTAVGVGNFLQFKQRHRSGSCRERLLTLPAAPTQPGGGRQRSGRMTRLYFSFALLIVPSASDHRPYRSTRCPRHPPTRRSGRRRAPRCRTGRGARCECLDEHFRRWHQRYLAASRLHRAAGVCSQPAIASHVRLLVQSFVRCQSFHGWKIFANTGGEEAIIDFID